MRKEDASMSNCKVIALTNQKGGVGKTTTAVNLGVSLVQQGKKVLLIDADAQANLTMALGYNRPDDIPITLSTVMQNIIDDKTLDVSQGIIHHSEGVDLLPSNIELSGFEVRLINAMSRERVLKTYVNEVKKNYDYVLIDCMPSLGMITINALAAADRRDYLDCCPTRMCRVLIWGRKRKHFLYPRQCGGGSLHAVDTEIR